MIQIFKIGISDSFQIRKTNCVSRFKPQIIAIIAAQGCHSHGAGRGDINQRECGIWELEKEHTF